MFNYFMNKNAKILHTPYDISFRSVILILSLFKILQVCFYLIQYDIAPTVYEKRKKKQINVRCIVRLQKQLLILVFLFGYYVNLPALYSMSMLPFDSLPIPFPICLPTHLPY